MSIAQFYGSKYRGFVPLDYGYKWSAKLGETNDPLVISGTNDTQLFPPVTLPRGVYTINVSLNLDNFNANTGLYTIYFNETKSDNKNGESELVYLCAEKNMIDGVNPFENISYVIDSPSSQCDFYIKLENSGGDVSINYDDQSSFRIIKMTP